MSFAGATAFGNRGGLGRPQRDAVGALAGDELVDGRAEDPVLGRGVDPPPDADARALADVRDVGAVPELGEVALAGRDAGASASAGHAAAMPVASRVTSLSLALQRRQAA